MTQVARVFVVLNLLLAVGFLFSGATILSLNDHWKNRYEDEVKAHENTRQTKDREITSIKAERDLLSQAKDALTEESAGLKGTNSTLNQQVQALTTDKTNLETAGNEMRQRLDNLAASVDRLQKQNERAQNDAKTNSDAARKARAEATKALADLDKERGKARGLENDKADLEKTVVSLGEKIKEKDTMIDYARRKGVIFANLVVMEPVRGSVVRADNDIRLAVLNVGSNDKVERGYVFDIVRSGSFIGRVEVETVFPSACSGTITLLTPGKKIMVGDQATTTLD